MFLIQGERAILQSVTNSLESQGRSLKPSVNSIKLLIIILYLILIKNSENPTVWFKGTPVYACT